MGEVGLLRTPPHNDDIEAALLAVILTNNNHYEKVSDILRPEHFYQPVHGRIFDLIGKVIAGGQIANPATLKHYFDNDPEAGEATDNGAYLYDIVANATLILNVPHLARQIYDLFLLRELIDIGENMVNEAYDPHIEDKATDRAEKAQERLHVLMETGSTERPIIPFGDAAAQSLLAIQRAYSRETHVVGVTTGFQSIDNQLGGLHPSDLIILAGATSMGKTALATNIALNAAKAYKKDAEDSAGARVMLCSLEMSSSQIAMRIQSLQSGVSGDKMRRGAIDQDEFNNIITASEELQNLPLYIDDTPAISVNRLRVRLQRLRRMQGEKPGLVIVDYLQLMQATISNRQGNRVQEIAEISRGLKALAKEEDVPILALAQLSREVDRRDDNQPRLSDLRESGTIEQDADVVAFIYRKSYYLERSRPSQRDQETEDRWRSRMARYNEEVQEARNKAQFIIAKQRHGPTGTVDLYYQSDDNRFADLDKHDDVDLY